MPHTSSEYDTSSMASGRNVDAMEKSGVKQELDLKYNIDENPPWYACLVLGLQHFLMMFGSTVSIPFMMAPAMCMGTDNVAVAEILCTILFMAGLITILQSSVGSRLPVMQGGTFATMTPAFAILNLERWRCPNIIDGPLPDNTTTTGTTDEPPIIAGSDEHREVWQMRMREIQGAILLASLFETFIGLTGLIGLILQFIGPLAIAPTIVLIGLPLFGTANNLASKNWWIAIMTIVLIAIFSQYLRKVDIPCGSYDRAERKCKRFGYPFFQLFPVILSVCIAWLVCGILTVTNAIPNDENHWSYGARADTRLQMLHKAKWFRFPYPGQWGTPTFSAGAVFGMLAGIIAGMLESVGDYFACARMCGAPPPPMHAVNRGIFVEGIGCVLAGCWGSGTGSATYSQNIGAFAITKVGSRWTMISAGGIMLVFGMFGKFGAVFASIPDPVMGGVFIATIGMITAVGISNLQYVDLNSARNLFIIGFSIFFGLALPQYVNANADTINSGSETFDQIVTVLLSTSMFVGGVSGLILDNTIPGTQEERGLTKWKDQSMTNQNNRSSLKTYELPYITKYIKRWKLLQYVPISPTFSPNMCQCNCRRKNDDDEDNMGIDNIAVNETGSIQIKF